MWTHREKDNNAARITSIHKVIPYLSYLEEFPPTINALQNPNGLLAAGKNVSEETILNAYRLGIFPWYSEGSPILWWSPDPRLILYPEKLKISRSLNQLRKKELFQVTFNNCFEEVIDRCGKKRHTGENTWITNALRQTFCNLHQKEKAISVESWLDGELVGGLYGLCIGKVFFGESMFSEKPNASKISLIHLTNHLQSRGICLIDCQVDSPHLRSLGAQLISRRKFEVLLQELVN
jgi:leucyl/phenylalanyl-tRNA--protein transferase